MISLASYQLSPPLLIDLEKPGFGFVALAALRSMKYWVRAQQQAFFALSIMVTF